MVGAVRCLAALLVGRAAGSSVTPVQKVVELLKGLQAKVEADGKNEAAAYDKYACFCKEQVDDKIYAIEKSEAKEKALKAKIDDLADDIAGLSSDIAELSMKIGFLDENIKGSESGRRADHKDYLVKEADVSGAIDSMERAISALKDSKGELSGKTKLESDALLQVARSTGVALSAGQLALLGVLDGGRQPGEAYQYEYHANDIIALLEGLLKQFRGNKKALDLKEFNENAAFERKRLALQNQKTFAEEEKLEKEKVEAFKTEGKEALEEEKTQETNDKLADQAFLKVLTANCEDKAKAWDQRSQTRTAELTAIGKAMEALETGVAPNYAANKKLVGLQQAPSLGAAEASRGPASFLQLRGSSGRTSQEEALRKKVLEVLSHAAGSLASPLLSVAALKVQNSKDHFVKVRTIIKDIISKLKDQASNEATTKGICDKQMAAAVKSRDEEKAKLESLGAAISSKEAKRSELKREIGELSDGIAKNQKALKEASELRQGEKEDNVKTMADAKVGKEAVAFALKTLKEFYENAALAQEQASYVPPNSDRSGKTVEDLAPEFDTSKYAGRQDSAGGILGLLEVILSDFERTGTTVDADEKMSAQEFKEFKKSNAKDTKAKEASKKKKEGEVISITDDLTKLEDDERTAKGALKDAMDELEKLHPMCVAGEETYEERVAKREKEIEALKEAHAILEDWEG